MASLQTIEGVGKSRAAKLDKCGIRSTGALLKQGCTKKGRKAIAADSNIAESVVLRLVNMCDLYRIKGVGEEYADLLEAAGVDTVPELAQRNAANLAVKMAEVNAKKKLVRQLPVESQVAGWVAQAKGLKRMIEY